jgi:hypothetical protein
MGDNQRSSGVVIVRFCLFGALVHQCRVLHQSSLPYLSEDRDSSSYHFCIMDFIWNELRRTMNDPKKFLPSARYIIYMIERVTMITFPKECKHEPLRIHPRSGDAPRAPPLHAGATRNSRFDPAPSYSGPSSSRRVIAAHSSKGRSRAFSACTSPWLVKLMRTVGIS